MDPTIEAGKALWHGYRNFEETPSMRDLASVEGHMPAPGPNRESFFGDLIYWLEKPEVFDESPATHSSPNLHIPVQVLLYLICGEWMTISEYIQTRLAQVEWEISFPEHFLTSGKRIDVALKKLHIWRRLVPLYTKMLNESLQKVFAFPCRTITNIGGNSLSSVQGICPIAPPVNPPPVSDPEKAESDPGSETTTITIGIPKPVTNQSSQCLCPLHPQGSSHGGPIMALKEDFVRLHTAMEDFQKRIDTLTSVVTASISIDDSHRGLKDTMNVTRLTYLATCFIPLSLTAAVFTMPAHLDIRHIVGWYFLTALLLVAFVIGIVFYLTGTPVTNHLHDRNNKKQKKF